MNRIIDTDLDSKTSCCQQWTKSELLSTDLVHSDEIGAQFVWIPTLCHIMLNYFPFISEATLLVWHIIFWNALRS